MEYVIAGAIIPFFYRLKSHFHCKFLTLIVWPGIDNSDLKITYIQNKVLKT